MLILINVVEGSAKHKEFLREKRFEKVVDNLLSGALVSGQSLNQETTLQRMGDTRWGSHFR